MVMKARTVADRLFFFFIMHLHYQVIVFCAKSQFHRGSFLLQMINIEHNLAAFFPLSKKKNSF